MKRAVIFGAGREGSILFYTLSSKYKVIYFIDNLSTIATDSSYMGLPVKKPQYLSEDRTWDVVIISTYKYMFDMCAQLEQMGLLYGKDYILPYDLIHNATVIEAELFLGKDLISKVVNRTLKGREIAIVYGNCQSEMIVSLLSQNRIFSEKYLLIKLPPVHYNTCLRVVEYCIDNGIFDRCKLFITQHVRVENRFSDRLSTDFLYRCLPIECKKVIIPDLYFKGYFPDAYDLPKEYRVLDKFFGGTGLFANGYRMIDGWVSENKSIGKILELLHTEDLYEQDYILSSIDNELDSFERKEIKTGVTVPISDYMKKNYNKKLLFYCFHHPTIELLAELCNRILYEIGIRETINEDYNLNWHMSNYGMLLYPSVMKAVGLDTKYSSMFYYPWSGSKAMSFEELSVCYINFSLRMHKGDVNFNDEKRKFK